MALARAGAPSTAVENWSEDVHLTTPPPLVTKVTKHARMHVLGNSYSRISEKTDVRLYARHVGHEISQQGVVQRTSTVSELNLILML